MVARLTDDDTRTREERLKTLTEQKEGAAYLVGHRVSDVMDDLRMRLGSGELVARGRRVKDGKAFGQILIIESNFWNVVYKGVLLLDPNTGEAKNLLGHYCEIEIGKNENYDPGTKRSNSITLG